MDGLLSPFKKAAGWALNKGNRPGTKESRAFEKTSGGVPKGELVDATVLQITQAAETANKQAQLAVLAGVGGIVLLLALRRR